MPGLVGEPDHLVLDGGAVARARARDLARVHRAPVQVVADDAVNALIGRGQPAEGLDFRQRARGRLEGEGHGRLVAALRHARRIVDRIAMDARGSAGLEAAERKTQARERRGESARGRLAHASALRLFFSRVHEAAQECAGRNDDGVCLDAPSVLRHRSGDPPVFLEEAFCHPFDKSQVRRRLECLARQPRVKRPVALRARPPDGRPARAVQDLELDARAVGQNAHQSAQRVDLPHQLALGETANCRIA